MKPDAAMVLDDYAWFGPGVVVAFVVGIAISRHVGRALRTRRAVAWVMVACLGAILSATLTPSGEALAFGATGARSCDLARFGPAPLAELLTINETSLNLLLFVPLGVAIGLVPRSRLKAGLLAAMIVAPFAIETIQLLATPLDRTCQSADVVDNLTGLLLGLAMGTVAGGLGLTAVARNGTSGAHSSR